MSIAHILRGPHLKTLLTSKVAAPTIVIKPLRFVPVCHASDPA